ncbi:MAG: hypothetical protein KAY37_10170 [Phycisphaerae bacterium]|nr:hypothetical protein [Phycisphaerae bacterium]
MASDRVQQVVDLAREKGLLRPRDLAAVGIPRQYLRMRQQIARNGFQSADSFVHRREMADSEAD